MSSFETMTAQQLNDWYERAVGYRPQVDDPTMSDDALRALCVDYLREVGSATIVRLNAALIEIETICTEDAAACRKRMGTRVGNALATARAAMIDPRADAGLCDATPASFVSDDGTTVETLVGWRPMDQSPEATAERKAIEKRARK